MGFLILGLLVFFGVHALPSIVRWRTNMVNRLGEGPYKGLFSFIAATGLLLIIFGMARRDYIELWQTPTWASHLALLLVLPAFILLAAAYIPGNIKRYTRHPMLWGVTLWSAAHGVANGDLGCLLLFGSFLLFSVAAMISANRRGALYQTRTYPLTYDLGAIGAGLAAYVVVLFLHPYLFGVSVIIY